ncbi:MAG TPA: DUF465 domain-containing protein [Acidobacteriaceae bacterium]|jgi:hypothetical protein|nr:DUF465 domain-containing protein [Acidobacteriaceae bacterium]
MEVSVQQDFGANGDDLGRLAEEHHKYALQLETLLAKPYPSEEDKLEEVRLKKLKLRLKDRIEAVTHNIGSPIHAA